MGYDIYIGEAEVVRPQDDGEGTELRMRVRPCTHPDAPEFPGDEMTGKSNGRHPSYSNWAQFCRETGLYALFYGPSKEERYLGLLGSHPGCFMLTQCHLDAVRAAIGNWRATHPTKPPGWDPCPEGASLDERLRWMCRESVGHDPVLARLLWLEWWMRFAIQNCKVPAIYNR